MVKRYISNNMSAQDAQASYEASKTRLPDGMYGCKLVSANAVEYYTAGPDAGKELPNPFIQLLFKIEHTEKNGLNAGRTFSTNLVFFGENEDSLKRTLAMADYIFQHGEPEVTIQADDVVDDGEGGTKVVKIDVKRPIYTVATEGQFDIAEIAQMMKERLCGGKCKLLMISIRTPKPVEGQPAFTGFNLVGVFSPRETASNDAGNLPTMD